MELSHDPFDVFVHMGGMICALEGFEASVDAPVDDASVRHQGVNYLYPRNHLSLVEIRQDLFSRNVWTMAGSRGVAWNEYVNFSFFVFPFSLRMGPEIPRRFYLPADGNVGRISISSLIDMVRLFVCAVVGKLILPSGSCSAA